MKRPRILCVAMSWGVHAGRWISQLYGQGWDIHVFPVDNGKAHPMLVGTTVHDAWAGKVTEWTRSNWQWPVHRRGVLRVRDFTDRYLLQWRNRAWRLARVIERIRPDLVHTMEMQHAGYLMLDALPYLRRVPPWMVSNWGSDIFLFGQLEQHRTRIRQMLERSQYYTCECQRDVILARVHGFKGQSLAVVPISGGYDVVGLQARCPSGKTSARKVVLLKGYQHWAGRALFGLKALELCVDVLKAGDYRVVVYQSDEAVRIAAELFQIKTGIPTECVRYLAHDDMVLLHSKARASIGLSISDGISHGVMEAMMMGSFPIQSDTACIGEWAIDGETGIFVPPEDPPAIAGAIRRALTDDAMVDRAAGINMQTARERLDHSVIRPQVIGMYERALAESGKGKAASGRS